jgi:hypothetical protein
MSRKLVRLTLALIVLGAASIAPLSGMGQDSNNNSAQETAIVGFISDSMCGLTHMSGMGDDRSCTLECVKGGSKFVLADRDNKRVYRLDNTGQKKAREFAGQKVKVTGRVSGKNIRVTNIEPA